jgi:hypothetical protein
VATLVARNARECMVVPVAVSSVSQSMLFWCVLQESGLSRHEEVLTFNLVYKDLYNLYTFSPIYIANAAADSITIQYKVSFHEL